MTIEATGERFIPEVMGDQLIAAEHVARYALAARLVEGKRVLDGGCGVGWGTAMLLDAGASSASGIDLAPDAVADARQRVPRGHFVQGDLARLPWDDATFDVVVCFETIEHVARQGQALDELARVLAPDGLLAISSPNPRVYPAGNPFHLHELTPEELAQAVAMRLPNVSLWSQHSQITSILVSDDNLPADETRAALAHLVTPLTPGSDPYSVVLAGRGALPKLPALLCCAPSDQLLHLEEQQAAVAEAHEQMLANSERVREEHERIHAERTKLLRDLAASSERVAVLGRQTEELRRQRERTSTLLLETEQQLAIAIAENAVAVGEETPAAAEELGRLYRELNVLLTSKSWRITAPLRAARRVLSRSQ